MQDDKQPFVRIPIFSPSFDVFRIDESYDIRKVIVNKKEKFDVSSAHCSGFPKLFNKFRLISNCQYYASAVLGLAIAF